MLLLAMERSKGATRLKKIKKMARCSCKIAVLAQFRGRSLAALHCHPGRLGTVDGIYSRLPLTCPRTRSTNALPRMSEVLQLTAGIR